MARQFAAKITQGALAVAGDTLVIESGESIIVYGVIISTNGVSGVIWQEQTTLGSDVWQTFSDDGHILFASMKTSIPFLADRGLRFEVVIAANELNITVFHSQGGA